MKRCVWYLLLLGFFVPMLANNDGNESDDTEITSRSYLNVVPMFQANDPIMVSGFRGNRTYAREDGWHGAMQLVLFGSRSVHSKNQARYFFPFGKTTLIVGEDFSVRGQPNQTDLFADHFNIFTIGNHYKSSITIKPRQSVIGLGFEYRQSLWRNEERGRGIWLDISTPLTHIKNQLNLSETILNPDNNNEPDPAVTTGVGDGPVTASNGLLMTAALKQPGFKFGKIDDCSKDMKKTRLADIELRLGVEWLPEYQHCHLESYLGIIIPTGNKPKAEHLFEAVVGHGKHVGLMFGSGLGVEIWSDDAYDRGLRLEVANNSQYLFKREQKRSIDLKYKPWSRYIQLYASQEDAAAADADANANSFTPGINILTMDVDVTPGFWHNMNCAIVYTSSGFCGEAGYNFFARRSENVKLDCGLTTKPAIKHVLGLGQTNPIRDITGNAFLETATSSLVGAILPVPLANYDQSVITADDLDLVSASSPCMLAHTVYASFGYNWDESEWPMGLHFGGSYQFSNSNNAVVDRWALWGKFTISL